MVSAPDRVFEGRVSRLVHLADVAKNTIEVKVAVKDPIPLLKPEMLARVRFLATRTKGAGNEIRQRVFAPKSAVQTGSAGVRVFVVADLSRGRGSAAVREVVLGEIEIEDHIEIASGLRPGDHVILDAPPGLVEGRAVVVTGGTR